MTRTLICCFLKLSSILVCLTLNHSKHYVIRVAAPASALPSEWIWYGGCVEVRTQRESALKRISKLLKQFSSPQHLHWLPSLPTLSSSHSPPDNVHKCCSHSLSFLEATSSCKARGKWRGGKSTLGSVSSWNWTHISLLSSRLHVSLVT